ncbi:MAG TPA: hotdog domain-containing protein [Solirubrobacteraceae bacterium]|jgi:3-hydroxyacyl-[acyl-carrier-protein] dehydratase|nr:hotdog domain-containing protein [Solirubrobacteraceae bacterium]
MRFHLIDRIDGYEPATSVRARKLTSRSEEIWEPDGDDLVMAPPLIFEALCQAATWLIMITTERRKRAALLSVGSVQWLRAVYPGDVLAMSGRVDSFGDESAVVSGEVTVDGEPVLRASEVMCALIDADTLADLDDTQRLQEMLTRGVQ